MFDVSFALQNKPWFDVSSYEPKTNPGLLCPAMSQKQSQVCYVLLKAKNKPRFVVYCYEPKTNKCLL